MQTKTISETQSASALTPLPPLAELSERWQKLSLQSADNFFATWAWVSAWLDPSDSNYRLFSIKSDAGDDLALAILSKDPDDGSLWLNAPASSAHRVIFCEYGGLLHSPKLTNFPLHILTDHLSQQTLHISGSRLPFDQLERVSDRRALGRQKRSSFFANLQIIRQAEGGYDALLSRNTRQQLARAQRIEETFGEISFQVSKTGVEANTALKMLISLQRSSFAVRGKESAFDSSFLGQFASALINSQANDGHVELFSLYNSDECLGILFNLVQGSTVANYQSGFALRQDPKSKIGYLVHKAAIQHYTQMGFEKYSFLAGDAQYKQSMSTDTEMLHWARLERPSALNWTENTVRRLAGRLVT
ncbi:MAG: GNAT family N-acetyltransferase [Alphaproteobacteria bacterium]|nr:MAG: GNAT family N-acetyltransferase [Alphaproteobacteria bacterium]